MSGTIRFPRADAEAVANDLIAILGPVCNRIVIAGSIRRQRSTVAATAVNKYQQTC